ncbi:hypothetical protein TRFO_08895 [Tritrichomonas foetus]|uniref:Uncharacterized protein n=1 Tax=Tritrichomonas foetus TaxID=1144522 RepID=A0A1J4JIZ5_9EUKA|nr:hypothetical protein TRFO_08892 [Tritrichomonas foetus]OHS98327.1 hypothetical protein TRFO_08895 [Tritrichomonas foetus]|eukprot:OHS98326.1 hypothetical protein TRFO_08892 [Tritrichomonas foetus]
MDPQSAMKVIELFQNLHNGCKSIKNIRTYLQNRANLCVINPNLIPNAPQPNIPRNQAINAPNQNRNNFFDDGRLFREIEEIQYAIDNNAPIPPYINIDNTINHANYYISSNLHQMNYEFSRPNVNLTKCVAQFVQKKMNEVKCRFNQMTNSITNFLSSDKVSFGVSVAYCIINVYHVIVNTEFVEELRFNHVIINKILNIVDSIVGVVETTLGIYSIAKVIYDVYKFIS